MQERLLYELGALALESKSRSDFRSAAFARISKVAGFDGACANSSPDGDEIHLDGWDIDAAQIHRDQVEYMKEFSVDEIHGITGLPRRRLGRLPDVTTPRLASSIYGVPAADERLSVLHAPLGQSSRRLLVRLFARRARTMAAREGLSANRVEAQKELLREHRVTRAERQVAELAERGLTNREIGAVLSRSANTVRNQLAACCRKLRVSSRTEIAYVLSNAEPRGAGAVTWGAARNFFELCSHSLSSSGASPRAGGFARDMRK